MVKRSKPPSSTTRPPRPHRRKPPSRPPNRPHRALTTPHQQAEPERPPFIGLTGSIGAIGITDYAQNSLGDIVYVDLPKVGDPVTANATFGSVESVKAVSDLFSPVTGAVTAVNEVLKSSPDKINEAPHDAWIIKVEIADPSQLNALLDAAAYEAFVSEETGG